MDSEQKFLNRLFVYRLQLVLQYVVSLAMTIICWWFILKKINSFYTENESLVGIFGIPLAFSLYNTFTYLWSSCLTKKYGIKIFSVLDKAWLKKHHEFYLKVFGKDFLKLIQCRKIAGLYMLTSIILIAMLHIGTAVFVGIFCILGYLFYRNAYLRNTCYRIRWRSCDYSYKRIRNSGVPIPGNSNFNTCNFYIQGTYEACVTGNAFVTKRY